MKPQRLIVAITGASGAILGVRLLESLVANSEWETHLIVSSAAELTIREETGRPLEHVRALADVVYDDGDVGASIASGSYPTAAMVVVPCSIKTLSAIANSYAANLVARAADVTLKEGRPLVLVVRETPLHLGHLRLMTAAAEAGAILFPPVPPFYAGAQSTGDMVDHIVGRILGRIGIANELAHIWAGTRFQDTQR